MASTLLYHPLIICSLVCVCTDIHIFLHILHTFVIYTGIHFIFIFINTYTGSGAKY